MLWLSYILWQAPWIHETTAYTQLRSFIFIKTLFEMFLCSICADLQFFITLCSPFYRESTNRKIQLCAIILINSVNNRGSMIIINSEQSCLSKNSTFNPTKYSRIFAKRDRALKRVNWFLFHVSFNSVDTVLCL